jgi:hypothetical protein
MTALTAANHKASQRISSLWLLAVFALFLLPLCFLGYGSDNDTYGVVASGYSTWHQHVLATSRNPGYWTYEAIVYVLTMAGGYIASNLATLAVATICIWRFLVISSRLEVRFPGLLAGALVAVPVFAIASTSTDDYVWSLLGIVLLCELLIADRLALAVLPAAFAFAVRGANGIVVAGAIAGAVVLECLRHRRLTPRVLQPAAVGLVAAALGAPQYFLSYHLAGNSMHFVDGMIGPASMWTLNLRAGRFVYKGLYLFGPIASLLLVAIAFVRAKPPLPSAGPTLDYRARATPIFAGVVLANLVLFFRFPIEVSYLIPAAYFSLLMLGTSWFAKGRSLTIAFLLATASANLVTLQFAEPNIPGKATGASFHLVLHPGQMIDDVRGRIPLRQCRSYDGLYSCYVRNRL